MIPSLMRAEADKLYYLEKEARISGEKALVFLSWFKNQLDNFLRLYFNEKLKEAAEIDPESVVLVEELRRFIGNGGKRIRPAFAYAGYVASGGRSLDAILFASASLEFVQAFALIHDDLIDDSPLRRGKPSVHKVFEDFHKNRAFSSDAQHFGLSSAILSGDLALSFADELLSTSPFPSERIKRAKFYFDTLKKQVVFGQHLDLIASVKKKVVEKDILTILEYKTAKYTVERPLQIGAALAGADEDVMKIFSEYGIRLGQAFQIQDDILGTFGNKETIGKPNDSDIKEGKKTLLVVKALEWAKGEEKRRLEKVLGNKKVTDREIEEARNTIKDTGALEYSQKLATSLILQAKEVIAKARLNDEGKNYLLQAADYLLTRQK